MTAIRTKLRVSREGTISGRADRSVPAGEHEAILFVEDQKRRRIETDFPVDDCGPWPPTFSLSRKDIYADDGR